MSESEMTNRMFFLVKSEEKNVKTQNKREAILVEQIRHGNQEAFNEFYKMFSPMVHGIILSKVPRDEVSDLVQEVFVTAYTKLHTLREANAVGGWLAMIARNYANDFYRKMKPTEELSETIPQKQNVETEAKEVLKIIRSLPESYRETLVLRLVEGMTGNEISEQTGLTPESVRVNLYRGMQLLREKLGIEK
ncbi:MAG: sigma-70 family RNA polymerase sigma factor [Pyrinomonadaceae bacterium]|nr:sigma-70 family RNA polymerase sigma factor [Pyrinomonadaceae bacterium]